MNQGYGRGGPVGGGDSWAQWGASKQSESWESQGWGEEAWWSSTTQWEGDPWSSNGPEQWQASQWQEAATAAVASSRAPPPALPMAVAAEPALPAAAAPPTVTVPTTRAELKAAAFHLFDSDADGLLRRDELRRFAAWTGFEGSDDDWASEYSLICKDLGRSPPDGIDKACFSTMVDDDSADGCFCSDEELRAMHDALAPAPLPPESGTQSNGCHPAEGKASSQAASSTSVPKSRQELMVSLFHKLDTDSNGRLASSELWPFVLSTGFEGPAEEWAQEYGLLCADIQCKPEVGLTLEDFCRMVDDDSDKGCYCTDAELTGMLQKGFADNTPATGSTAPAVPVAANKGAGKSQGDSSEANFDPWAAKGPSAANEAKGKGKASGKGQKDPWAMQQDPWSTPAAKRVHNRQERERPKLKEGGTGAAAEPAVLQGEAGKEWGKWVESGQPGAFDISKPVLNVQKLLEASRAANAARKVKEDAEAERQQEARPSSSSPRGDGELAKEVGGDPVSENTPSASSTTPAAPRAISTAAATAGMASAIARLAAGDRVAVTALLSAVAGAPSPIHLLALASNATKALLQGRLDEAKLLLSLEDLLLDPSAGEAALLFGIMELARAFAQVAAPFLLKVLQWVVAKVGDKHYEVQHAAAGAAKQCIGCLDAFAFEALLPALLSALDAKRSPAVKLHALQMLAQSWKGKGEAAVAQKLPQLIPVVTTLLLDTNHDVRTAAGDSIEVLFALCGNKDLGPFMEEILSCARGKKDVAKCIKELAEVVFVQRFEAPALAVVMPILTRGLKSRNGRTQRQASIIAENVCRLVPSSADVEPFLPQLLPLLKRVSEDASDSEVRAVAGRAHDALAQIAEADVVRTVRERARTALSAAALMADVAARDGRGDVFTPCPASVRGVIFDYVIAICVGLGTCSVRTVSQWNFHLLPHLESLVGGQGEKLVCQLRDIGMTLAPDEDEKAGFWDEQNEDDGGDVNLCDCTLTLACGATTLLSGAHLRLARGRVYGLVGANDVGKTTLLRAIHERKVSGFPPRNELVSALVEHGVGEKAPECEWTPAEYLLSDPMIKALDLPKAKVASALNSLGFDNGGASNRPIKTLSGGWRMKLGLARAMLQAADVLLLDEPTGHLDSSHVDWLVDYVKGLTADPAQQVTTLIVSHSAAFLDRVCTHIILVQDQKLKICRGNFSEFVQQVPDAQLGAASGLEEKPVSVFVLPEPGSLEDVKSRGKRFLYLEDVSYAYPNGSRPAVRGATVECSLNSRVAIVGPNGAGKSTLAALVVGELAPDSGTAWRHPNLRMTLVAQHTFRHLEQHIDLTATEYILWRFEANQDREALDFMADEADGGEAQPYQLVDGMLVLCNQDEDVVEPQAVLDRRQRGRFGYEYEVRWQSTLSSVSATTWVPRWQLGKMGHLGMAKREDTRQAAMHALVGRPLTTPAVEAHLAGFGLNAEEASHRRLGALSYGQRARAVLGAATWLAPHLLVLDEPSNYLDQPALAAMAAGLLNFGGGVVIISHNNALVEEVCTTKWIMDSSQLRCDTAKPHADDAADPIADAKASASKEAREKKKHKRLKELRRKNGEVVSEDEDWWADLLKKTNC